MIRFPCSKKDPVQRGRYRNKATGAKLTLTLGSAASLTLKGSQHPSRDARVAYLASTLSSMRWNLRRGVIYTIFTFRRTAPPIRYELESYHEQFVSTCRPIAHARDRRLVMDSDRCDWSVAYTSDSSTTATPSLPSSR
jgi:hypothetical protein